MHKHMGVSVCMYVCACAQSTLGVGARSDLRHSASNSWKRNSRPREGPPRLATGLAYGGCGTGKQWSFSVPLLVLHPLSLLTSGTPPPGTHMPLLPMSSALAMRVTQAGPERCLSPSVAPTHPAGHHTHSLPCASPPQEGGGSPGAHRGLPGPGQLALSTGLAGQLCVPQWLAWTLHVCQTLLSQPCE